MDVQKLNAAMEGLKEDLRSSLVATCLWVTKDAQDLVQFNSPPQATALFNKITLDMKSALAESKFPGLGNYYVLDLVNGHKAINLQLGGGEYQWGILVDETVQLGLILNVIMPKLVSQFEEALAG